MLQAQLKKNQAVYENIKALKETIPTEMPALPNTTTLAVCKKEMEAKENSVINICYRYVTSKHCCTLSHDVLDRNAQNRITTLCYDDFGLLADIKSYDYNTLLEHVSGYKNLTDPILDCEELANERTVVIKGYYSGAVTQIEKFVTDSKQSLQQGREKIMTAASQKRICI